MANGLFTLRQVNQAIRQGAWNSPTGTYAGSFNGSTQYLSTASSSGLAFSSSNFTVEGYVYFTSVAGGTSRGVFQISTTAGGIAGTLTNTVALGTNNASGGKWEVYAANTSTVASTALPIINTYYHFAVVRNSGTTTLYINGSSVLSVADSTSYTGTYLGFGGYYSTSNLLAGNISNLRVVNGTALYTANFTPPVAPLQVIANTSFLTLQNSTIIDNSVNAVAITNNGSVTTSTVSPGLIPFPQSKTSAVEYLVVAGGGGGGKFNGGGGGGAGGLLTGLVPITAGSAITVTVGAGGAGSSSTFGANGSNSVFGAISSVGGGGGGASDGASGTENPGRSGGSGGGSGTNGSGFVSGGQGTFGQGNAGGRGNSDASTWRHGGGGGGAGTVGLDVVSGTSGGYGIGGAGIASSINGTVTTYAGGGGGGVYQGATGTVPGGVGGGGSGGNNAGGSATAGTTNTGGGGGGGGGATGAAGGSGIVIVSYPDVYAGATATTGSPTVSTSGSGSIYFNGSSNTITSGTGSFNPRNSFTIEFWINASSFSTVSFIGSNANNLFYFETSGTTLFVGDGTTNTINTTNLPTINTWTHVALSFDGTTYRLFYNGTSQATSTTLLLSNTISAFRIAQKNDGNRSLTGYISNLRVLVGTALYTSNFTPPTAPLTAITNTTLLLNSISGAYLADNSANSYTMTTSGSPAWNASSPFTVTGYKNRVYTWTSSGSITF